MSEKPIFEVIGNTFHFKIYASGMIEGFPDDGKCLVFNRIGIKVMSAYERGARDAGNAAIAALEMIKTDK